MKSWRFIITATCALSACRLAGPDDLVNKVSKGDGADSGLGGSPEELPSATRLGNVKCDPKTPLVDPSSMVDVPAGEFGMGCDTTADPECVNDAMPAHSVGLKSFKIDLTEVSQEQYYACVASGACLAPTCDWDPCNPAHAKHPVVCVNRADALAYCTHVGKRLPTEAEWEKAARGQAGTKFPWGNDPIDCTRANLAGCVGGTEPVGSHPSGASVYGALDMAGNVVEWVSDIYDPDYYKVSPPVDPEGPPPAPQHLAYVGRGGGWASTPIWHRTTARDDYEGTYFKKTFGLRCAAAQ